ncbi:hypothetical protein BDN67DRAFT_1070015 [Paxillus ammoniavirescens]|nr:hypothetical protein BDN67DRAFT_1070015 [Paxillus ammoniavirescens]
MAKYTRTLKISSKDLGQEATLVLVFDKFDEAVKGPYETVFPLVWIATEFGAKGVDQQSFAELLTYYDLFLPCLGWYNIEVTYNSQLAFIKPGFEDGKFTYASTFIPIDINQKTTLSRKKEHYEFTKALPVDGSHDAPPKALNESGSAESIAVGFMSAEKHDDAIPVFLCKNVGHGSSFSAQITPVLRVYVASPYRQGQILKSPIGTPVWEEDLSRLEEDTTWSLKYTEESGVYTITQAD